MISKRAGGRGGGGGPVQFNFMPIQSILSSHLIFHPYTSANDIINNITVQMFI